MSLDAFLVQGLLKQVVNVALDHLVRLLAEVVLDLPEEWLVKVVVDAAAALPLGQSLGTAELPLPLPPLPLFGSRLYTKLA